MVLSQKLHVSQVTQLVSDLRAIADSMSDIELDASQVESVDTPSLQALCSLQKSLHDGGSAIHWLGKSKTFVEAADKLGVAEFLAVK